MCVVKCDVQKQWDGNLMIPNQLHCSIRKGVPGVRPIERRSGDNALVARPTKGEIDGRVVAKLGAANSGDGCPVVLAPGQETEAGIEPTSRWRHLVLVQTIVPLSHMVGGVYRASNRL